MAKTTSASLESSAPASPSEAGKALRRKLLLEAAYDVFSSSGYHRTRLGDVAAVAGYSKASVYNYFEDKEELFLQTSITASSDIVTQLQAESQSDGTALATLRRMLRHLLSDAGGLYSFVQAVTEYHGELQTTEERTAERTQLIARHLEGLRGILQVLAEAIQAGKISGEFRCSLDELVIARMLTGLVRSVLLRWRLDGAKTDVETELDQIMAFAAAGLHSPSAST